MPSVSLAGDTDGTEVLEMYSNLNLILHNKVATQKPNVDMTSKQEIPTLKPKTGVPYDTCSQKMEMAKIASEINF